MYTILIYYDLHDGFNKYLNSPTLNWFLENKTIYLLRGNSISLFLDFKMIVKCISFPTVAELILF